MVVQRNFNLLSVWYTEEQTRCSRLTAFGVLPLARTAEIVTVHMEAETRNVLEVNSEFLWMRVKMRH